MAREFRGKIPRVPVDADTSKADRKLDRLFDRVKGLQHINIDADVSQAQRRLETLVKRTNSQLTSSLIGNMVKDFRTVLGAMKTEFDSFGDTTDIYKKLESTCDMVEERFANLTVSVDKKKVSGLVDILNTVTELKSISDFSFGEVVPKQAVKNAETVYSKIKAAKQEIGSIVKKVDYIQKTLSKGTEKGFSTKKLQQYQEKLKGLSDQLQAFYSIDDDLIQNALVNAAAKINEALGQIDIQMPKAKGTAEILSTGETLKELGAVEKKTKAIEEVTKRISKNSSIKGIKDLAQEAVSVTKALSEMYDEGIRDTERYITLQYRLKKIFDEMGKSYGGVRKSGARDGSELLDLIIDGIEQRTGINLFGSAEFGAVMEDLFGSSDFSLFNKSLSKLGMKDVAEFLLMTGKTGDWVDMQVQVTAEVEKTADVLGEQSKTVKSTTDSLDGLKEKYFSIIKTVETYLELMSKFNNIEGNTWAKVRKNMIDFIKDMPQDVIGMLGMEYGEKFTEGLKNSFKGMSTKDLWHMIRKPSFSNTMDALELRLNLAKNVDFDNIKYTDDGSIKLADSDNPFEHLHPQAGIKLMEELYKTLDVIAKITSKPQEQLTNTVEKTTDAIETQAEAIEQATAAKSKYYAIDEGLAKRAKEANSFSDYIPGSATQAYRQAVDELSAIVESKKAQFPDRAEELDRLLDTYAKRYAEYINKQNAIDASVPSIMIAGPSGISQSKKDKQNQRREANYKFFQEKVEALETKIKELGTGAQAIRTDDDNALDALEQKVEELKKAHQIMVEANKYFRKHKTLDGFEGLSEEMKRQIAETRAAWGKSDMQPFPQYVLQNSNQEIKRLEARIKEIQGLKLSDGLQEINDVYSLVTDKQDMRIRISFEIGKPDQEVIDMLKGKAFKWSPKNNAWQRQLTDNAIRDTKRLQEFLHTFYGIEDQVHATTAALLEQKDAVEQLTDAKSKSSKVKVREFAGMDEYLSYQDKYRDEHDGTSEYLENVVDIVPRVGKDFAQISADMTTSCKNAETAVRRFFSAIDPKKYPELAEWESFIKESMQNGLFSQSDKAGGWAWEVQALDDNTYYVNVIAITDAIKTQTEASEQLVDTNKKLTSSYKGLAEAVEEFVNARNKANAAMGSKSFWELDAIATRKRLKVLEFIPEGTEAIKEAEADLSYRLARRESRNKTTYSAEQILKLVEQKINKANLELEQKRANESAIKLDDNKVFAKMNETLELIGTLQSRYGTERFGEIFGDIGTLDVSNAEAVYDTLIAKEQEYTDAMLARANAQGNFIQTNGALISDNQSSEPFMTKLQELCIGILDGNIGLEEANRQLQEFASTLTQVSDAAGEVQQKVQKTNITEGLSLGYGFSHLAQVLDETDLDKFFKQFNIAEDQIDGLKQKFIEAFKASDDFLQGISQKDLTGNILDELTDDIVRLGSQFVEVEKQFEEFRQFMQGKRLHYDDSVKAEGIHEWSDFYKSHQKYLTKSSKGAYFAEDIAELVELFPELFPRDILEKGSVEQFYQIMEVWDRAREDFRRPLVQEISLRADREGVSYAVDELYAEVLNKSFALEGQLADATKDALEGKQAQAQITEQIVQNTESQAEAEKKVADAAHETAGALKSIGASTVSVEELISRDISEALAQLRSAKDNETTLISLKGVFDGDDLVDQFRSMVENIASQANLSVGKIDVSNDTAKVRLYNEELKVTVDQTYKLRAATEETEAMLELVGQSFSQNVKALNENTFDTEGIQQRALAAVEKIRASLHGLEYDLTDLETAAKSISSQDDFTKFNNQLKATQDNIQAIKNSTVSKSSMNPLANMQRDMQNASIEIETMRLRLEKFGDIQGVSEAKRMLEDMTASVKQYHEAISAQEQQNAYNQYSNTRSSFKAQTEYIKAAQDFNKSQSTNAEQLDPIREQYQSILELVNKINSATSSMLSLKKQDGGTGFFSEEIERVKTERERLIKELEGVTSTINNNLSSGFIQGKEVSIPSASFLDSGAISSFLNDIRTQTSLTTEEVNKLIEALQKSQNIDVQALSQYIEKFKLVEETSSKLMRSTTIDPNNETFQALGGMYGKIMQYKDRMFSESNPLKTHEFNELQALIEQYTKYGNALADASEKEARYFAGKTKYAEGTTMSNMTQNATEEAKKLGEVQKQLEEAAQKFAQESGGSGALITKFVQSADGISHLDFSVFDTATSSLRNFRMEMGSVTDGMYVTETTVSKSLANIQAAQKQMQSTSNLLGKLSVSNVNVSDGGAPAQVQRLLELYKQLSAEIAKGDGADSGKIVKLTQDLKMASSATEKLYKQMLQMDGAIASGQVKDLGIGNPNGNVYAQLVKQTKELAAVNQSTTVEFGRFDAATNTLNASLVQANGTVKNVQVQMNALNGQMTAQQTGTSKLTSSWSVLGTTIARAGKRLATALVGYNVFFKAISMVRKGIGYVKEIDLALTELKKVTNETQESYRKFLDTAGDTAGRIGSTVSAFTEATANFARLGYTMEESAKMAETAVVYKNVADGLDTVDEATESIISTMKAFGIESNDTMGIIDRFNEVGNNFAITSAGIGEALQRSASALYAGGNTIDEAIGLVTAANSVIQNPEQVGTALKTLSLRIRGVKTELEEAGLETEGMAETTSQLQAKLKALTHGKVDILLDADTFKNTTQILREMSAVWGEMTDMEQAAALELLGGKRQANILSSLISNFDTVEEVITTSMNSSGSAMEENAKYMDSIAGKSEQLTNAMQTLWNNAINSDMVKGFLDLALNITKAVDSFGLFKTALMGILFYFTAIKKINPAMLFSEAANKFRSVGLASNSIAQIQSLNVGANGKLKMNANAFNTKHINDYANAVSNLTFKQQAARLASAGLSEEHIRAALTANGAKDADIKLAMSEAQVASAKQRTATVTGTMILAGKQEEQSDLSQTATNFLLANSERQITNELLAKAVVKGKIQHSDAIAIITQRRRIAANIEEKASLQGLAISGKEALKQYAGMLAMMASTVIAGWISKIKTAKERTDELTESYKNLQSAVSEAEGEIESIDSELKTIEDQINTLRNKSNLSTDDAKRINILKQQSEELTRQKEIQEKILATREQQEDTKSLQMINNLLKTTAAGQQKAAENTAAAWKIALGAVMAIGAAIGGFYTGGATWSALPTAISFAIGGAAVGAAAGEKIGYGIGMSSKEAGDSLVEWYESYEEAIAEAETKAAKAESKYMSNMTEKNYDKWQKKLEYVNELQTDMYDGLTEMQDYVSNLEYNDETSAIIDGYNSLMAHIDVKSMGGDIDAQISSIEALKTEYAELSRGVDEHGNNIALSAEEYARYQAIVAQVLGYNVGLTQTFTENGSAIYNAKGELVGYNAILAETINLLKQQQKQAAIDAIEGENGDNAPLWETYKNAQKAYKKSTKAGKKGLDLYQGGHDLGYGSFHVPNGSKIVEELTGVDTGTFYNYKKYIYENIDKIYDPKVYSELIKRQEEEIRKTYPDFNDSQVQDMLDHYVNYLEGVKNASDTANKQFDNFKQTLKTIPQISDYYDNLSGDSLDFVNNYVDTYVDGLENIEDLKEFDISTIKNNIESLTDELGYNEKAQELISDMFAIDADTMSVDAYQEEIRAIYDKLLLAAPELQNELKAIGIFDQETWFAMMVPTDETIQHMQTEVGAKLKDGLSDLAGSLSLPELKIAFKYRAELEDGSSYSDLMQLVERYSEEVSGPIVQTYSTLQGQVEQFNELAVQTSEIILDNTKVTQEYKDSLIELGISEEELAGCFDATNGLVVTNAKELNRLINATRKSSTQNVRLAKSQAILQYYELCKQISEYTNAAGQGTDVTLKEVDALRQEANALEKAISKYAMLEAELLGATNAYEEFQKAQEVDSETDYIGSAEEMALALGKAFNTAELGSESAQAAIKGLVPESVHEDLDTVDEKMEAIYKYFRKGKIAQYFKLEYDDDGNIESAEMKLGNLRKFIEDGLSEDVGVFEGADWQHFELSDEFLESIKDAKDPLQAFADEMNVTKEVAFAFLKTLKDHDIEWLNGDYSSLLEQLIPETFESRIYKATQSITDLDEKIEKLNKKREKNGSLTTDEQKKLDEYTEQRNKETQKLEKAKTESRQNMFGTDGTADQNLSDADGYLEANLGVIDAQEKVTDATKALTDAQVAYNKAKESGASDEELDAYESDILSKTNVLEDHMVALDKAVLKRNEFATPTTAELTIAITDIDKQIKDAGDKFDKGLVDYFKLDKNRCWVLNADVDTTTLEQEYPGILKYVGLLNSKTMINAYLNGDEAEAGANALQQTVDGVIAAIEQNLITLELDEQAVQNIATQANRILSQIGVEISASLPGWMQTALSWLGFDMGGTSTTDTTVIASTQNAPSSSAAGQGKVNGTAHASGNWGLPTNEHNSLVGELGPELVVDPQTGRYYTVGDNGAEMVDLPKGAIIFNHKQTEGLLKNGYVTSRGKAYAEGNAHVTIWPDASSKSEWKGTGYSGPDDPTYDLSDALSNAANSASDAADEFEEALDWIEIRLEELDEVLGKLGAELENATNSVTKNNKIDQIIAKNREKMVNLESGADYYERYANKFWSQIPAQYQKAAQNGAIAITDFAGEASEQVVEAIQSYRDYVQKAADLRQQKEETKTEIRDLYIQKIDNAEVSGSVKATVEASQTEKLQNAVDYDEERGLITSSAYYTAMMENSNKTIEYLTAARNEMQKAFNEAVQSGDLVRGSDEWYENLDKLYQIDSEIDNATKELEEFQNAINDIYWDNFDELINRLDYLKDETQSLIDLMDSDDMIAEPKKKTYKNGTVEYWGADDVQWTKEGIASMGLYAQQMEIAEYQSKQYAKAIDDLTADYDKGLYSENEYLEKLNELKDGQYENIEAYYDAQDAIVELNETRIDSIKEGIEAEIDAYSELIDKKKEELSVEKDLYDFQKGVAEQQKSIADIQRKIAALSGDNSASAVAKRKQLEAELYEAQSALEETYYDRSIENQQTALDKELEDFQAEKDAEIEKWEEYLTNVETVVAESLGIVQANALGVYDTLSSKAQEYDLTLSESIMTPWQDGSLAVSDYQTTFDTAMSSTTDQLDALKNKWQEVIDKMVEAGEQHVATINKENANYAAATKKEPATNTPSNNTSKPTQSTPQYTTYTVKSGDTLSGIALSKLGDATRYNEIYNLNRDILSSPHLIYPGQKLKLPKYAKGTLGVKEDQWALIDELGEELVLHAGANGKVEYLTKGTGVIPTDLTERLMDLAMDPQEVLDRNRPKITPSKSVVNNNMEIKIDASVGELIHVDRLEGGNLDEIHKVVDKAWDKKMQGLNNAIRKFSR